MRMTLFFCLPFCASILLGQGRSNGLSNLKLPYHAREAALGDATVAGPNSISSFLVNPALLRYVENPEIAVSHQQWIEDVRSEFISAAFPFSFGVIGVSLSSTSIGGIELRDQPGPPLGTFASRYGVIGVSGAASILSDIQAGITLRYLYEKIYVDEAEGWGLDLGLHAPTGVAGVSIGASLRNIGKMGHLRSASTQLPATFTGGLSFQTAVDSDITASFMASLSRELSLSGIHATGGIEFAYARLVMVRMGYATGYYARGFSAGVGFASLPFLFDYSFTPFTHGLGSAHLVSLGVRL